MSAGWALPYALANPPRPHYFLSDEPLQYAICEKILRMECTIGKEDRKPLPGQDCPACVRLFNMPRTSKKAEAGAAQLVADKEAKPPKPIVHEDIQAPYHFNAEELALMNVQLRQVLNQIDQLDDQKKASAKDFALRITNKENEAKMLRNKLDSGEETRPVRAVVEFDVPRSMKRFLHPTDNSFIREEPMTPADWQLPMFKPDPVEGETVAPKGAQDVPQGLPAQPKPKKGTKNAPGAPGLPGEKAGQTPVGDVLDQAAANGNAPAKLKLDLTQDYTPESLLKAYKDAAKASDWTQAQISVIGQQLKLAVFVEDMLDTLRPHTEKPAPPPEQPPFD